MHIGSRVIVYLVCVSIYLFIYRYCMYYLFTFEPWLWWIPKLMWMILCGYNNIIIIYNGHSAQQESGVALSKNSMFPCRLLNIFICLSNGFLATMIVQSCI